MFITNVDEYYNLPDFLYERWHKIRIHRDIAMFDPHSRSDMKHYENALSVLRQKKIIFIANSVSDIETKCPRCGFNVSGNRMNSFGWGEAVEICPICGEPNPRYKEFVDLYWKTMHGYAVASGPVYSYNSTIRYAASTSTNSTIRYEPIVISNATST